MPGVPVALSSLPVLREGGGAPYRIGESVMSTNAVVVASRPVASPIATAGFRSRAGAGLAVIATVVAFVLLDTDLSVGELVRAVAVAAVPLAIAGLLVLRGGPAGQGAGAVVAGTLGVALAPALVAPLVLGRPSGAAIVGLVGSAVAAAFIAWGGIRLYRVLGPVGRLAAVVGGLVAIQFFILPVVMGTYGTHPVGGVVVTTPPAGAERVAVPTEDGVDLAAWFTPSRNGATVMLRHGAGGSKADTVAQAAVLAEHGYGVLALDARGSGESGGRGTLWGWHGNADVAAALAFLAARPEVDPERIGAVGLSMGGEEVITIAAADPRIRAVVAEGASARVPADAAGIAGEGVQAAIQRLYYPVMWGAADLMTEAAPPIPLADAVQRLGDRRLLLISSDDPNDHAAGPLIRDAAPANVELWEPPNTGHTQALATHRDEWVARVIGFLDRELRAR
jgi:uncharacterized protein